MATSMSSALGIVIFALAAIIGYGARTPGGRTQLLAPFVLGSLGLAAAILSVGLLF